MADVNVKKFSVVDFNPDKYVKEISQVCLGGQELQLHRAKVQSLAEETSAALKKNVYQNYMQFIETAKEISHLESEMYQLFHLLTEQRTLLGALSQTPAAALDNNVKDEKEEGNEKEDKREKLLAAITEKVEGCASLLDVPNRGLLYEGDLLELDPLENTPLHRVHAYLLTDIMLVATWISNRRGPARYKFQTQYELGSLAVVNVRDLGNIRHAFKLLAFPDSRVFQCISNQSKREWLDHFEVAKKARLAQDQQKRETVTSAGEQRSPVRTESLDSSSNPFGECEDGDGDSLEETPDWLMEVPEDLDVLIAQRHFEDAHALIEKTRDFLDKSSQTHSHQDIRRKTEQRVTSLINALTSELAVTPDKSLQGGLRAARRSVRLLNLLGRNTQACDLFLQLCSSILKAQMKRVKREGAAVVYVKRISRIFFSNLTEMIREFQFRAFPNSPAIASVFVVWVSHELMHFTGHLVKQVFVSQSSISTLAECVTLVREQCQLLCELGVDICFQLEGQLSSPLTRALVETRDKLVDSVKLRSAEDNWQLLNLNTRQGVDRVNTEFMDHGLPSIKPFCQGDHWILLTSNTVAFIRVFMSLLEDGLKLVSLDLMHALDKVLYDVISAQLNHVNSSLNSNKHGGKRSLIIQNGNYLMDCLKVACERLQHSASRLKQLLHHHDLNIYYQDPSVNTSHVVSTVTDYL